MKKHLLTAALSSIFFLGQSSEAQSIIRQVPCSNENMMHQADSIKQDFSQKGFIVLKEASMTMESEYEMPVIVPLIAGGWYQFVFIGDNSSRLFEVRMYDWNENQVAYEKNLRKDAEANIISFLYIPRSSEYHMIKQVQVNNKKKKGLCGYVMLFKKVA